MIEDNLADTYREYLACLNRQDWEHLSAFVDNRVSYNGQEIGLSHYTEMLIANFADIPDLYFDSKLLISDPSHVAARLDFDCTPKGEFLGLPVNGRRVSFSENVFYEFRQRKIVQVWSVIDKMAIEVSLNE